MADNSKFVQGQDYKLSGSGVTATDTSITLQAMKLPDDSTNVTMTDFGDLGFAVIEPATSREENISFTGITQNGNGTATLTGVTRGLKFVSPYDQDTALRKAHAGGSIFRVSNTAGFYDQFAVKDNDETITGVFTFEESAATPRLDSAHTYVGGEEEYLATKRYADSLAIAGAPDMSTTQKGIAEEATQAEVDARTAIGGTGARLAVNPGTVRGLLYNDYAADAGGTDAYAITVTPAITAYAAGQVFNFKANTINTGAATLNVNGLGAITIKKNYNQDLANGDIAANQLVTVIYDGTNMQMTSQVANAFATQAEVQDGSLVFAADGGGTDAYAITLAPAPTAYTTGMMVTFTANTANTGAATLNVNSLGAITIKKNHDDDLDTGDIEAGQVCVVVYDGTNFQLQSSTAKEGTSTYILGQGNKQATGIGTQVIAHNLGRTPKLIKAVCSLDLGNNTFSHCHSVATSVANQYYHSLGNDAAGTAVNQAGSNFIVLVDGGTTSRGTAAISAIDTTTFTLNWTTDVPGGTFALYTWEVYG